MTADPNSFYTVPVLLRANGSDGLIDDYLEVIYLVEAGFQEEAFRAGKRLAEEVYQGKPTEPGSSATWMVWMVAPPAVIYGKLKLGAELNYRFYDPTALG